MAITKLQSSRDFFRIWFYWKKQAVFLNIFIITAVMFYAYTVTPKYQSFAQIMLLPKSNRELVLTAGEEQKQFIQSISQEDLNTEITLIKSDKVIQATITSFENLNIDLKVKDPGLFDKALESISEIIKKGLLFLDLKEKSLSPFESKVELIKRSLNIGTYDSNILEVSLVAERPKQAAKVLERLIENYIKHHNQVFSIDQGHELYDDQADIYREKLLMAEQKLEEFYANSKIIDLDEQNRANINLFTELRKELQYIEISCDEAESRIRYLEGNIDSTPLLLTKEMRTIPSIIELEKSIIPLITQKTKISKTFTKESREYKDITAQIEMLKNEILTEIKRALETDKLEFEALTVKKKSLQKKLADIYAQAGVLKENARTLQELKREVEYHKQNYMIYASKRENSRLYSEKKKRNLTNITVVDQPSIPVQPFSPQKMRLLLLSVFLGFISALMLPFILESVDQKLKSTDDIEILLELPVIASFSKVKS